MKTLLTICLLSSIAVGSPLPKDPRIEIAKRETAKLYRGHVYHGSPTDRDPLGYGIKKVSVLEQHDTFFLTQVSAKNKKNFCFIFEVSIVDNTPEVSVVANNNEVEGVFIQACSDKPTVDELSQFKTVNNWPQ